MDLKAKPHLQKEGPSLSVTWVVLVLASGEEILLSLPHAALLKSLLPN